MQATASYPIITRADGTSERITMSTFDERCSSLAKVFGTSPYLTHDEVLQEVRLAAHVADERTGIDDVAGYTFILARNRVLRLFTAETRHHERFVSTDPQPIGVDDDRESHVFDELSVEDDYGCEMDAKHLFDLLRRALMRLSDRQRQAIELRFFQSKAFREIGEALHVSTARAAALVKDGLATLRRTLSADCNDEFFGSLS
jgi:RNA polymerase sigma factor (sigma-70 family)